MIPIDILSTGFFIDPQGVSHQGGLYPFGENVPPSDHAIELLNKCGAIEPLNTDGIPDAMGKIGFISVGASSQNYEMPKFIALAAADPYFNTSVKIVNTSKPSTPIADMLSPTAKYWTKTVTPALNAAGLHANQVQIVYCKPDSLDPITNAETYINNLTNSLETLCETILYKFPSVKIIFFSGRNTTWPNPADKGAMRHKEPRPLYNSMAIKRLIERQINGDIDYSVLYDWCAFLHTDNNTPGVPNTEGHSYTIACVQPDGIHPSELGQEITAECLYNFFSENLNTKIWFTI